MPLIQPYDVETSRRVFRVGGVTVDELRQELRIDGKLRPIDRQSRALLIALLERPKDVLSKRDLYVAGWGNADNTKEGSLNTAIFKLRGSLGSRGHEIVLSIKDQGYTIGLPVETWMAVEMPRLALGLKAGDEVPARPQWRLDRPLDPSGRMWRAVHEGTRESWVFSFADTVERSITLQREMRASQDLHYGFGDSDDWLKVVDCEFDRIPYFIARPYAVISLSQFAASGGLQTLELTSLIDLAVQITRTVLRAHSVGVPHGAIRPGRIMITKTDGDRLKARLTGFLGVEASGVPTEERLSSHSAAHPGSSAEIYMAPEVKAGGSATAASDIYAIGVLLLGLVTRSLQKPLTPASVAEVDDPLLQSDIVAVTSRDQGRRLEMGALLPGRLEALPRRREELRQREAYKLQRERYQRIQLALGVLAVALVVAAGLAVEALHQRAVAMAQRDRATQISAVTEETVSGLVDDIAHGLGERAGIRLNVLQVLLGRAEETLGRMISLTPGETSLRRLQARGLTEFGRTFWDQDDLPRALALGTSAASIQRSLLDRRPNDTSLWIDLAESQRLLGDIKMRQRDQVGALTAYQSVLEIDRRLEADDPGDGEGQRRLAQAEDLIGDVQMAQGRSQDALVTYRTAEAMIAQPFAIHADDESWLVDVAANEQKVGDALDSLHDWRDALVIYQKEAVTRRKLLARDPGNNGWRHDLSQVESSIGDEQYSLKELVAARASYLEALALNEELARADPTNETWQRNVAVVYADIGDVADALGDRTGTIAAEEAANLRMSAVAARSPEDADLQRDAAGTEMNLADGLIKNGEVVAAAPHAERAIRMARQLAKTHPDDPDLANALKESLGVAKRAGLSY